MRYVITWLVLAAGLAIGIGSINWPFLHRIARRGVRGEAVVVGLFPENHNTLRYEYHVAGRTFRGQNQSEFPNPPLKQLAVGRTVVNCYEPEKPEDSVLGNPDAILKGEMIAVLLAATIFPTLFVAAWARMTSRKQTNNAKLP
jgi:hypothetical protein